MGENAEAASSFVEIIAGIGSRTGLHPMSPGWCTFSRLSYAALPRYCRNYAFRFSMLDETVETRRPWRGSPHPCVHAGVFLRFMGIISTVSKPLRYSLLQEYVCATGARGLRPLRCGGNVVQISSKY